MTDRVDRVPEWGVPEWLVERLAAGDLDPDEARCVRARLEARGELGRLAELEAANRAFLAAHPADRIAGEIQRRARAMEPPAEMRTAAPAAAPTAWPGQRLAAAGGVALATAVLSIWLLRRPDPVSSPDPSPETVRLKGLRPHLVIYKKTGAGPDRLPDRGFVRPGDTVQVAYVAAGRRFGVVASIDARGMITLHLPEDPGPARELSGDGETPLPHAFVLDDSPGFERFVLVTGDRAFDTSVVVDALRSPGGGLPPQLSISDLTLEKESP